MAASAITGWNYPDANIDPREKGYDWFMQYAKAAYGDSRGYFPTGTISVGSWKMQEIKSYVLGKQPVDKYKKAFKPGDPADQSWRAVDWTVPAFMSKYLDIAAAKILQKQFDIQAFVVDPTAKAEQDEYFNRIKIKIMMREQVEAAGLDINQIPQLRPEPGEPQDMEQLKMYMDYGYKHMMAIQAENAIMLIQQQNNEPEIRKQNVLDLRDYGVAAKTQWIDENGMVKERAVNMEYFGCSYCEKPDFSDMIHWFEIVPTYVADLAPYYTKEQLDLICESAVNKYGNPASYAPFNGYYNRAWMRFKVMVMHIKFLTYNQTVYKEEIDGRGNMRFGKTDYKNKQFLSVNNEGKLEDVSNFNYYDSIHDTGDKGQQTPKYMSNVMKVSCKASWILETDFMHNWGFTENQNRKLSSWWDTDLDIQIYAPNFNKMQFTSLAEKLIPLEDKACMTWFNLQNLSNKLIPYLIAMDMTAIEAAGFGKGGDKMKPSEIIDFIFSNFVVPYRAENLLSRNPNYKPISIEASGQLAAFGQLYEELAHTLDMMRQISGLNEATDASTIQQKTLNGATNAMLESTNNALYLVSEADKYLMLKSADAIVQKVQIAVRLGKVEGYARALGTNMVQFFQIDPDISLHELGIFIEDAPTTAQREALWTDATLKESQGLLTPADKYYIMSVRNLKEAAAVLDYKINQRKKEAHEMQMQLNDQQAENNAYVAQAGEVAKQESIGLQLEADLQKINLEKMWELEIERLKKTTDLQGEIYQSDSRTIANKIQAEAKVIASQIAAAAAIRKEKAKPKPAKKSA